MRWMIGGEYQEEENNSVTVEKQEDIKVCTL
jgi:hypothetical protein